MRYVVVILVAVAALWSAPTVGAQGTCLTREQAITVIAHKVDVEHGGRLDKALVWAIADRESGLRHCDAAGRVKVSATGDHGLLQLNPGGVWTNCAVNPYCRQPKLMDDPYLQIDVMLNYADVYGDLCPWNPEGHYLPGCGYGATVRSAAGGRAPFAPTGQEQGDSPQMRDLSRRALNERDE